VASASAQTWIQTNGTAVESSTANGCGRFPVLDPNRVILQLIVVSAELLHFQEAA
jgi:hypothetical protein